MAAALKERETLYKLIISQLRYDGLEAIAANLSKFTNTTTPCPPSARLHQLVNLGTQSEADGARPEGTVIPGLTSVVTLEGKGVDLEYEPEEHSNSPQAAMYETYYVTAHKGPCRIASFSGDGRLVATGSADASIKVLDVERMVAKNVLPQVQDQGGPPSMENHPVIRTLYDHTEEVTALQFHPTSPILISGSKDCTIKVFDISKPSAKKAYRGLQEAEPISSLSMHPGGDFFLVAAEHPTIRMYDTNTFQCFVAANPREYHKAPINQVCYSPSGNLYASCSQDGCIKIWDGVSSRCVSSFPNAHNGAEVYSVVFSRNSKYLISAGKDSLLFLWELSTGRAVNMYTGGNIGSHQSQVSFNHTEDYVICADEKNNSVACWDTRTTEKLRMLQSGHNNNIRCLVHSTTSAAFVTCSDDFRARFWYCQGI